MTVPDVYKQAHSEAMALRDSLPAEQRAAWDNLVRFHRVNVPSRGEVCTEIVAASTVRIAHGAGDPWWTWDLSEKGDAPCS